MALLLARTWPPSFPSLPIFFRHSRGGGNPDNIKMYRDMRYGPTSGLDSRLRGDDEKECEDDERGAGMTAAGMTEKMRGEDDGLRGDDKEGRG
jgi:hypothetical protein